MNRSTKLFILAIQWISQAQGDFIYHDFNHAVGLVFNGNAMTWICNATNIYVTEENDIDATPTKTSVEKEGTMLITETISVSRNDEIDAFANGLGRMFGHRDVYIPSSTSCFRRIRLTPSKPSQVGSIFHEKRFPVIRGFDAKFQFQISDQSRVCRQYFQQLHSKEHHMSCAVHGGDGFAFVIHGDSRGSSALGDNGQGIGYGGIANSLAIEFDMWGNINSMDNGDMLYDHVSIHSGSVGPNAADSSTLLGQSRPIEMGDGRVHQVRIQYIPFVEEAYLASMTANSNLIPFIKDNGEGRRLGTLAVFVDDLIQPLLSIPLNLSVLLDLPQTVAYIGFTASTGDRFQNHDILNWSWCNSFQCSR